MNFFLQTSQTKDFFPVWVGGGFCWKGWDCEEVGVSKGRWGRGKVGWGRGRGKVGWGWGRGSVSKVIVV